MEFPVDVTLAEAKKIQEKLRHSVRLVSTCELPKTIAGVDVSSNRYSNLLYAVWVVFTYPDLVLVDRAFAKTVTSFPYVPGFLSFREIPALLQAWKKLRTKPDVTMVDGQGIAHPRRLGIASHLGLVLDIATIGCAKSKLYGVGEEPYAEVGAISYLHDPKTHEMIGAYVRTKARAKPLVISPGHNITLGESVSYIQACTRRRRIPEPTRQAHELVNAFRRGEIS